MLPISAAFTKTIADWYATNKVFGVIWIYGRKVPKISKYFCSSYFQILFRRKVTMLCYKFRNNMGYLYLLEFWRFILTFIQSDLPFLVKPLQCLLNIDIVFK